MFESSLIVPTLLYYFYSKYIFEKSNIQFLFLETLDW